MQAAIGKRPFYKIRKNGPRRSFTGGHHRQTILDKTQQERMRAVMAGIHRPNPGKVQTGGQSPGTRFGFRLLAENGNSWRGLGLMKRYIRHRHQDRPALLLHRPSRRIRFPGRLPGLPGYAAATPLETVWGAVPEPDSGLPLQGDAVALHPGSQARREAPFSWLALPQAPGAAPGWAAPKSGRVQDDWMRVWSQSWVPTVTSPM